MQPYAQSVDDVARSCAVSPDYGLASDEAARRLSKHGKNLLIETGGTTFWKILWEQFTSTMVLMLLAAAILSLVIGSIRDAISIMAIVFLFALLGFIQEFRAERAMRALTKMAAPNVRVRRDGEVIELQASQLVPGDIVLIEAGNVIPADCRLFEAFSLSVQESLLTGEADAVEKQIFPVFQEGAPIADQTNMIWMGTVVTTGRGAAMVVATGMRTEMGRIAGMLQSVQNQWTPLQKRLDRLGKFLAALAVAVAILVFGVGVWRGEPLREMLLTAVSLAVAAIPEGLPAVVTITLAMGAQRMLKQRALIRRLAAVETLGSVTVICTDKTGTLTENRMTVTRMVSVSQLMGKADEPTEVARLRAVSVLCNDVMLRIENGQNIVVGDPTEAALVLEGAENGIYRQVLETFFPRIAEIPFDSATKRMVTIHEISKEGLLHPLLEKWNAQADDRLIIAKGASDAILAMCIEGEAVHEQINRKVDQLASQGERVLAMAFRLMRNVEYAAPEESTQQLSLLGLVAMMDPPRQEAGEAVHCCLKAGIRPIMITGDHPLTAQTIAAQVGILSPGGVLTGPELDQLGLRGMTERVQDVSVYSRVSPEHKLQIIQALQDRNEIVAMTGDGVNDAPALKRASIGVAMGITGTDVAKESADMVLLDDNFATIVSAVKEGRTIYDNLLKFIEFSVAGNLGKILAVLLLPFLGLPNPLAPLQLLWLNLLTDGLLGLGMGMERSEPDVMSRPPLAPNSQIFDRAMLRHTVLTGGLIGLTTILLARHYWGSHPFGTWQTVLFTSLAFAQIGQAMSLRSRRFSFLRMGFFTNPLLLLMVCTVVILQLLVVYLPVMQPYFHTMPLTLNNLVWVFVPGIVVFTVLEIEKLVLREG